MQTSQGVNSTSTFNATKHDDVATKTSDGNIPARIFDRTVENVGTMVKAVPAQLKANPLALLGVGIGVGVLLGAVISPFSRLFAPKRTYGAKELKAYRKQIIKALGI